MINSFLLPRLEAVIAGHHVVVEFTNTSTPGYNLVTLSPPTVYDGTAGTVKRTDFVFLEMWLALVAPSPPATGTITVVDANSLTPGDVILIAGIPLTASPVPGAGLFEIVAGDNAATALNISQALDLLYSGLVSSRWVGDTVAVVSSLPGSAGNATTLSVVNTIVGALEVSGAFLTGGEDRYSKPPDQTSLYRHGNVLSPAGAWLPDDMLDPITLVESAQRVQLQYRIRTTDDTEGVNYKKHPDGFSTLGIYAQAGTLAPVAAYPFVPADKVTIWLNSSAEAYGAEDSGLWVAGNGSGASASDLGALDGFVYALPLCFVHRHNDVSSADPGFLGFDPVSNANGAPSYTHLGYTGTLGVIPAGSSDRPDGHFCDVIEATRILDLRRHVNPTGIDSGSELQYQIQSLLDGANLTWSVDTASKQDLGGSSGDVSTQYLICNEMGRISALGGNDVTSGTTGRGVFTRNFDHIARRFGSQAVVERVVFSYYPGDRFVGAVLPGLTDQGKFVEKVLGSTANEWVEDDKLHLDLANFDASTLGCLFQGADGGGGSYTPGWTPSVAVFAPRGTVITDVLSVYHDDGLYTASVAQEVQIKQIVGLGTTHLEVTLDANPTEVSNGLPVGGLNPLHAMVETLALGGSQRRIFLEVEITYPLGAGLTDTPDLLLTPDALVYDGSKTTGEAPGPGPVLENDAAQRPNDFEQLIAPAFRNRFREVMLEYVPNNTSGLALIDQQPGVPVSDTLVSRDTQSLVFPRRVFGNFALLPTVLDNETMALAHVEPVTTEFGSSSRLVTLLDPLSGAGHTQCNITYFSQDPIPNYGALGGGYQLSVYYRSTAPQTAGTKEGNILSSGDGVLPTILMLEPMLMGPSVWSGQVSSGSQEMGYPYEMPLGSIPINDELATLVKEWYFCATTSIAVGDFNANTGLLNLHPYVPADGQGVLHLGGAGVTEQPRVDAEFRAFYPFTADWAYRPTILAQPLLGAVRHKVLYPFLARVVEETHASDGYGILFRKNEVVLVVLTRFAELDGDNNILFTDTNNTTCAAVYRTKNMLLVAGDKFGPLP